MPTSSGACQTARSRHEAERAIVVAASHAEPHAVTIEADERQEHDIEQANARELRAFGLGNAEAIARRATGNERAVRDPAEAHAAHARPRVYARQIDEAAAAQRERDEAGGVELFGGSGVDADAPAGTEIEVRSAMARDPLRGARTLGGGDRPASRPDGRPQGSAGAGRLESGSVTRLCRCEPLLSNQSNKWDELWQVRLSAHGGLAQCCRRALPRGCFN